MGDEWIFTVKETETLLMAYLNGEAPQPVDEDDLHAFIDWAEQVRVDAAILENILSGKMLVQRAPDGDWVYKLPEGVPS